MTARHLILIGVAHLLIAFGFLFAALSLLDALEPPPLAMPLLIRSSTLGTARPGAVVAVDYPVCVTVKPPSLLQPPEADGAVHRLKDGGIT